MAFVVGDQKACAASDDYKPPDGDKQEQTTYQCRTTTITAAGTKLMNMTTIMRHQTDNSDSKIICTRALTDPTWLP